MTDDNTPMLSYVDLHPRGHPVIDALMDDPQVLALPEGVSAAVLGIEADTNGSWHEALETFGKEAATGAGREKTLIVAVALIPFTDDASTAAETQIGLKIKSLARTLAPETRVNAVTLRGVTAETRGDAAAKAIAYLAEAPAVTGQVLQLTDPAHQGAALDV